MTCASCGKSLAKGSDTSGCCCPLDQYGDESHPPPRPTKRRTAYTLALARALTVARCVTRERTSLYSNGSADSTVIATAYC